MLSGNSTPLSALLATASPWRKVCLTIVAAGVSCLFVSDASAQQTRQARYGAQQVGYGCPSDCRCNRCQSGCENCYPSDSSSSDPSNTDPMTDNDAIDFNDDGSARNTISSTPVSLAPHMIGDFGGGMELTPVSGGTLLSSSVTNPIAAGDRRFKIAENNSPIPVDRFFLNYNHFQNAATDVFGTDRSIDRFVFGLEKTFLDGWASLEARVPFASGVDSHQIDTPGQVVTATEFGNVSLALKALLYETNCGALAVGLGVTLPTASDGILDSGGVVYNFENESVHFQPFVGFLRTPTDRLWIMAFAQLDFDANGNQVYVGTDSAGTYQDQNLLLLDLSIGYWLYSDPCACRLTGVASIVELHYTGTINEADIARTTPLATYDGFTNAAQGMDFLNLTFGLHFQLGCLSNLRVAGTVPLREGYNNEEKLFDSELAIQFNRFF